MVEDVVVKKFTFTIASPDEFLVSSSCGLSIGAGRCHFYERAPGLTILRSTTGGCQINV